MRKFIFLLIILVLTVTAIGPLDFNTVTVQANSFPDEIELPGGFFPEGIAIGRGTDFYVGSLSDGSIYKGNLRTGEGSVLTDPAGQFATIGIEVDKKDRIWVAGGPTGQGRVYDGATGDLLATYKFTEPFESFVNDVVVTNEAAYFTDSGTANPQDPNNPGFYFAGKPRLFVVSLGKGQALPDQSGVSTLDTDVPDIYFPNLNGIETTPGGGKLVVAHLVGGALFSVDPVTGNSVDLGVDVVGPDGLIRRGKTIYVVENPIAQISVVTIAPDGSSGTVTNVLPVTGAETPATAGLFGNALYVADARFNTPNTPATEYWVYRVEIP